MKLFAPCPRGLEPLLAAELGALGASDCRTVGGGVAFAGDRRIAYLANLHSRLASRVLMAVGQRRYRSDDELYKLAAGIEWERHFDSRHTLRVDTSAIRSPLRSLNFANLRVKDGIVDRLRERTGERPSIDTRSPDVRVWLFLEAREATLYLDLSGEALFKRGWRSSRDDRGDAPLKENLAAGLLALAGWTPAIPLVDPFCGSGTIAIEAAGIAFGLAPGLSRSFGFERLLDHDAPLWARLRGEATGAMQMRLVQPRTGLRIAASDIDPDAVERARRNLDHAGLPADAVRWSVSDFSALEPPFEEAGFIVSNPPYGQRIEMSTGPAHGTNAADGADLDDDPHASAMRAVGHALRGNWAGWQAWLLSSDPQLPRQLGMTARRRTPLFNGAIECRLFGFEVFEPRTA